MRAKSLAIAVALLALWVAGAAAQEHPNVAKGLGGGLGGAGIDTVNPFNGNMVLRLPIGQAYPVNASLSYQLALVYNSQVWEHESDDTGTVAIPARGANAGLGWSLHLGRLNPPQLDAAGTTPDFNRNTYLAPDGSLHTFYPTLHEGEGAVSGVEYTRDGSYLRLKTASRQIELPDGTIHTFSSLTNGYLTRIEDRFGNFVQMDYLDCTPSCVAVSPSTAHRWQITDTQGRIHRIDLRDTGEFYQARIITQVDLQAFGGSRAIYKFLYNDSTDDQSATGTPVGLTGCGGFAGSNHVVWFLTKLVLPDGSVYDMPKVNYFASNIPGDLNNPCKTGLINRLRLPTLGLIEWDYILYRFPSASTTRNIWQKSTGVGARRLLDAASASIGAWSYTTALSGGTTAHEKLLTNSVTDPLGNRVARYFSVCVNNCTDTVDGPYEYGLAIGRDSGGDGTGRFLSAQVFDAVGALLRTTYSRFEHDTPGTGSTAQEKSRLNQRLASQRASFNDDPAGTYADESFSNFDGLGHYRSLTRGGNLLNSGYATFTNFNPAQGTYGQPGYVPFSASSPWIIGQHTYQWVSDGVQLRFQWVCIDPQSGFLSGRRRLVSGDGSFRTNDLVEVFTQSAGNVTSEMYYGGDAQAVTANPTQGTICSMVSQARSPSGTILTPAYQYSHLYASGTRSRTSVMVGTVLNLLDLTIDASTGLPSASRDSAGMQATFSYDTLGRLTTVDPANDLLTTYSYCTATSVPACPAGVRAQTVVARKATVGGTEVTAIRSRFDDWGRLIREEERMPPSGTYAARIINYNALGWKTYVSEQGTVAYGTGFQNYDAFGRPRTIRPPDGAAHDISFSYQGVRQVSRTVKVATSTSTETNATTTEIYDRYGRLYEVTEPNGSKTRYEYDGANHLRKVCQGATGTGTANCGQQRIFNYDLRDFLLSEQHPEKGGASGNGFVFYFNYDARGHALRKVDGPNDLTLTYDKAERWTQVRETGGSQRVLKTLTYASQNVTDALGTDRRKGKMVSASRFNYVGTPFNSTAEVRDTFSYRGTEGRASEHSRQLIYNGVDEEKFTTIYTYDGLGLASAIGYPDCVFGDCATLDSPRTVNFGYSYGRLVSVPGFTGTAGGVSQITYHSNGLMNQVPHANGVLFTQQNDPTSMTRPSVMTAVRGAATLWTTGTYTYDGAGNLKAVGTHTFVYDSLSRVVQGNLAGSTQSYTFDAYGNIQSITTGGSLQNTPTSAATNRLTSGVYDTAGNLNNWNGNLYEYDPFNLMKRYISGGEEWHFIYGADDERLWAYGMSGVGFWTLRDLNGKVLRRYSDGWTQEDYVYREGLLLAGALSTGEQRHFDVDHLGSVRLVTDGFGNQLGFHRYYPFGKEHTALQEGERMKFAGHERDLANLAGDGDDLDYMHARHYNPLTGRFLSTDPVGGLRSLPQSWNRYAYVLGSPLTYTDPFGLFECPPGAHCEDIAVTAPPIEIEVFTVTRVGRGPRVPKEKEPRKRERDRIETVNSFCRPSIYPASPPQAPGALAANVRTIESLPPPLAAAVVVAFSFPYLGPWDFKNHYGAGNEFEIFGNFHFGAVAAAAGIPREIALWGAGLFHLDRNSAVGSPNLLAPPYGDDHRDQFWIKEGYMWDFCR
jgi:RHS repeat-associated protein